MKIMLVLFCPVGGGVQVSDSVVRAMAKHGEHQYYVLLSEAVAQSLGEDFEWPQFMEHRVLKRLTAGELFWSFLTGRIKRLDVIEQEFHPDIVYTQFGPAYWRPKARHVCGYAIPHYVYPESPFFKRLSLRGRLRLWLKKKVHFFFFKRDAHCLVTENPDISARLRRVFPAHRVYTVSNTYNQVFDEPGKQQEFPLPAFDGVTLLSVAANYPHKNLDLIPGIVKYWRDKHPEFRYRFVVTVSEGEIAGGEGAGAQLLCVGKVPIQACPSLYRQADLCFMPTLLECFTATYAESMRMGVPVVTTDLSFARGICGDAAEYFRAMDAADAGEVIWRLATDAGRRAELVRKGYERVKEFPTAEERVEAYLKILGGGK